MTMLLSHPEIVSHEISDDITRRKFVVGGAALAAFLVGCGKSSDKKDAAGGGGGDTGNGFPRTVHTGLGDVALASRPGRVVTLGYEASVVLDLGIVPVGMGREAYDPSGIAPYNREPVAGKDVTLLDTNEGEIPYEQVAALRPDIILAGTYFNIDEDYERLSKIAPVVSYRKGSFVDTWQEQANLIGEALGEEAAAAAAVSAMEARISAVTAAHPAWARKTFSLSFNYDVGQITTITNPADFSIKLMNQLGFVLAPGVAKLTENVAEQPTLSYEQVDALDADVLILAHASEMLRDNVETLPVFGSLPAVRDGHYVFLDLITVSALRTPMLRGIGHALDVLVPELERAAP